MQAFSRFARSRLRLGLAGGLVAALALAATLAVLPLRAAHAAGITDSTCTSASYAADLVTWAGSGGTITFTCASAADIDVTTGAGGPGTVSVGAGRSLSITSTGASVTLDGEHAIQVFYLSFGSLTLDHLTIANGTAARGDLYGGSDGGGVFMAGGTLSVTDSTFRGNAATGGGGVPGGTSPFENGYTTFIPGGKFDGGGGGGAVFNDGGTLTLTNSTFSGNSAGDGNSGSGGGVYILGEVLNDLTPGGTVTLTNSTFSGNSATKGGGVYNEGTLSVTANSTFSGNSATNGGGVFNDGTLMTLTDSTFSGNSATSGGGAYNGNDPFNDGGTLSVTNSTFSGNTAYDGGGAFNHSGATLSVTDSTFSGNAAGGFVDGGNDGGGVYNNGGMSITDSTFSGNSAKGADPVHSPDVSGGGGAFNGGDAYEQGGTLTLTNSTFSGNSAGPGEGGGVLNDSGTVTLTNSTVSGNSAARGGGVAIGRNLVTLSVTSSILANNFAYQASNCNSESNTTITDGGYNLESGGECGFTGPSDLQGTDPMLAAALANNGGPTQTLALHIGSPAIDRIPAANCPPTDQRGVTRLDYGEVACDIGAYEVEDPAGQVGDLLTTVDGFGLAPGIQASFDTQLQAVQADLAHAPTKQTCGDLHAFLNHVQAQTGKQLTAAQANQLIMAAKHIQAVLGC